jgi:predicted esterase
MTRYAFVGLSMLIAAALAAPSVRAESTAEQRWCAPELEAVTETVCYFELQSAQPNALVIFLHGLTKAGTSWQWEQQRLMVRTAKAHGFSVLMPRGRPGIGPGRDADVLGWPTSKNAQLEHEDSIVEEWRAAQTNVEQRGRRFEHVLVFGFSNGAYYAGSLALRGRLEHVDGYGVFAGGSGNKYQRLLAAQTKRRAPIFVGYGTRDPDHKNQRDLANLLRKTGWKHRVLSARVGHTVTDNQISAALRFLLPGDERTAE